MISVSITSDYLDLRVFCAPDDADLCKFLLCELDDELARQGLVVTIDTPVSTFDMEKLYALIDDTLGWDSEVSENPNLKGGAK